MKRSGRFKIQFWMIKSVLKARNNSIKRMLFVGVVGHVSFSFFQSLQSFFYKDSIKVEEVWNVYCQVNFFQMADSDSDGQELTISEQKNVGTEHSKEKRKGKNYVTVSYRIK